MKFPLNFGKHPETQSGLCIRTPHPEQILLGGGLRSASCIVVIINDYHDVVTSHETFVNTISYHVQKYDVHIDGQQRVSNVAAAAAGALYCAPGSAEHFPQDASLHYRGKFREGMVLGKFPALPSTR